MAYYINRHGELASTYGMVDDPTAQQQSEKQSQREAKTADEAAALQSAAEISATRNASQERIAEINKPARAYNQGGAVYKHAHPTYTKFGKTGDSSLLAKGRK